MLLQEFSAVSTLFSPAASAELAAREVMITFIGGEERGTKLEKFMDSRVAVTGGCCDQAGFYAHLPFHPAYFNFSTTPVSEAAVLCYTHVCAAC